MVTVKEKLNQFGQITEVNAWLDGIAIKPTTRTYYVRRLYELLDGEAPKAFLDSALKNP